MKIPSRILDIAYGFAKDMATSGHIPSKPEAIAKFARGMAKELMMDFGEADATA